jgi:hypothetical protein
LNAGEVRFVSIPASRRRLAMTMTRSLTLAAAVAAAAVLATGCGSKNCGDATPPVKTIPAACVATVGQPLAVPVNTCPKCDQETPTCDVRDVGGGVFTLEPVSQVCDPKSCPIPNLQSCAALPTSCVLPASMTAGLNTTSTYHLNIVTETGQVTRDFTVVASGGTGCTGAVAAAIAP